MISIILYTVTYFIIYMQKYTHSNYPSFTIVLFHFIFCTVLNISKYTHIYTKCYIHIYILEVKYMYILFTYDFTYNFRNIQDYAIYPSLV